jgi:hypothetical protein
VLLAKPPPWIARGDAEGGRKPVPLGECEPSPTGAVHEERREGRPLLPAGDDRLQVIVSTDEQQAVRTEAVGTIEAARRSRDRGRRSVGRVQHEPPVVARAVVVPVHGLRAVRRPSRRVRAPARQSTRCDPPPVGGRIEADRLRPAQCPAALLRWYLVDDVAAERGAGRHVAPEPDHHDLGPGPPCAGRHEHLVPRVLVPRAGRTSLSDGDREPPCVADSGQTVDEREPATTDADEIDGPAELVLRAVERSDRGTRALVDAVPVPGAAGQERDRHHRQSGSQGRGHGHRRESSQFRGPARGR